MLRPSYQLALLAAFAASFAGGCCCAPCIRMPCINELDRYYPGSDDCQNGGPCGDPEDVGGRQTGIANCETCARQKELTGCSSCGGGCSSCGGGWFPWTKGFTGGGCGRFYWDEWWSDPPCKCEPCDLNGNYCGGQGICRAWRLGLPMPMLSRNCCAASASCCSGSRLSYWAANRKTCWSGCLNPCRSGCSTCSSGTCSTGACSSGSCHIDSVGYDATCDHCNGAGGMPMTAKTTTTAPALMPGQAVVHESVVTHNQAAPMAVASRPVTKTTATMPRYSPTKPSPSRMPARQVTAPMAMSATRRG